MSRIAKPKNKVRVVAGPAGGEMILCLVDGKGQAKTYLVTGPGEADGGLAFLLREVGQKEGYHVLLAPEGPRGSLCDCPGFLHTGACKHTRALLALRAEGAFGTRSAEQESEHREGEAVTGGRHGANEDSAQQ